MEPSTQPIEVISLHGQQAELTSIELASMQDQAAEILCSFAREVAGKTGVTWTRAHEDQARLLIGALVDAAEERLSDAIIELTREMLRSKDLPGAVALMILAGWLTTARDSPGGYGTSGAVYGGARKPSTTGASSAALVTRPRCPSW